MAEGEGLLAQADQVLTRAESVPNGSGSRSLPRVYALRGDAEEARMWLDICREIGNLMGSNSTEADSDMDSIRHEPWFQEFLQAAEAQG